MRKFMLAVAAASLAVPVMPAPAVAHGYNGKMWQDSRGRWRCKRPNGTTGLIVGGGAGMLAGRAIDRRGDRAPGAMLGAALGALMGGQLQKSMSRCR